MKRINEKYYDEKIGAIRTTSILPSKIVPNIVLPEEKVESHNEKSLWDTIARYFEHPAGLRPPLEQEIPNEEENALLSGTMTKEQRLAWILQLKQINEQKEEEQLLELQSKKEQAKKMLEQGENLPKIASQLGESVKTITEWIL